MNYCIQSWYANIIYSSHLKYRRKIIYNQYREDLIEIFKLSCSYKGVEFIEGHMVPDSNESS